MPAPFTPFIGQSNALRPTTGEDSYVPTATPNPGTYAWDMTSGGWIAPYGSLIDYCNARQAATNKDVRVMAAAVGGSAILPSSVPGTHLCWLDPDPSSPLSKFRAALAVARSAGFSVDLVDMTQGEQDAYGSAVPDAYMAGVLHLHAIIAGDCGLEPAALPFVISPLGNASRVWTGGLVIHDAHRRLAAYPGIRLGAEYADLPVLSDNIHLTNDAAGRGAFAVRKAQAHAPIIGAAPVVISGGGAALFKSGTITQSIGATGTFTLPSSGFVPRYLEIAAVLNGSQYASWEGFDDGITATCFYDDGFAVAGGYAASCGESVVITSGSLAYFGARVQSFDPVTGVTTMAITRSGTPGGSVVMNYTLWG